MKQKFFTGLLCLSPVLGFSQSIATVSSAGHIAANINTPREREMTPAVTVTNDDMFIAHGKAPTDDQLLSVNDFENTEEKIKVYPNPLGEYIFVETGFTNSGTMQCILYDAAGKQMMNMFFNVERGVARRIISTGKLGPGTYFLHAMYNGGDISSGTIFTIKKK